MNDACQLLAEDLPLAPGTPGGQIEYRRSLASSFFFKFYLNVSLQLRNQEVRCHNRKDLEGISKPPHLQKRQSNCEPPTTPHS